MKLSGNTVLITGGATGIGYALAESFLENRNTVIICGRREEKLLAAQQKHPEIKYKVCDVADEKQRETLFSWVKSNFSDLNILVNNAGIQRDIDLTKGLEDFQKDGDEIKINFEAPVYLSALFTPFLAGKKNAAIITVSSGLAFMPMTRVPIYCATKAAVHSFCASQRKQLSRLGIKVFELIPPMILDTELNLEGREKRDMGNLEIKTPSSADFAAAAMKGLENDQSEIGYGMTEDLKKASLEELERRAY